MKRLDEVVDRINRLHGSETIVLGSQQYTQKNGKGKADVFANAIKHDFRSPSPTTRWSEVIRLNSNAKKKDDKNDISYCSFSQSIFARFFSHVSQTYSTSFMK
jgi:hypothetical protein